MTWVTETTAQQIAAALWAKSDTPYTPPAISNPDIITDTTGQSIAAAIEAMPSGGGGGSGITPYSTITAVLSFDVQAGQLLEKKEMTNFSFIQLITPSETVAVNCYCCALAVNQDNRLFLTTVYYTTTNTNNIRVWYLDGSATSFTQITTPPNISPSVGYYCALTVNQSNRLFLAVSFNTVTATYNLRVWYLDGSDTSFTQITTPSQTPATNGANCALAVNKSNRLFLATTYYTTTATNTVRVWYLDGSATSFTQITTPSGTVESNCYGCTLAVNKSNRLFLAIGYYTSTATYTIRVWYLDGSATSFTQITTPSGTVNAGVRNCALAVNQDNRLFFAVVYYTTTATYNVRVWYLDGSATSFTQITTPSETVSNNAYNCSLAVNQDNRLFLAVTFQTGTSTNGARIWYLDGSATSFTQITTPSEIPSTYGYGCDMAVSQSNRLFLAISYYTTTATNSVRIWYLNDNFWEKYTTKNPMQYIAMGTYQAGEQVIIGKLYVDID